MSGEQTNINWNEGASTSGVSDDQTRRSFKGIKKKETDCVEIEVRRVEIHPNELEPTEERRPTEKDKENLHEAIEYGEIDEVKEYIRKFPSEKLFIYNGISALSKAFCHFHVDIFKLLISKSFHLNPDEDVNISKKSKKKAFEINLAYLNKPGCEYLTKLVSKCGLYNCEVNKKTEYFASILQALLNLNKIPQVKVLLEILALCSGLQIAFDFGYDHIGVIDPRKDKQTRGCFHPNSNCITIGAKNLLDPIDRFKVYGTMAHEFCHCALQNVFKNNANPYFDKSTTFRNKYEEIVDFCEKKIEENEIIRNAFSKELKKHAELIVRVPHLLAAYEQNKDLLDDLKIEFEPLFDYYDKMLPFLQKEAIKMRSIDSRESANKATDVKTQLINSEFIPKTSVVNNIKFDLDSHELQIFQSNCIEFTMRLFYEKLRIDEKLDSFVFASEKNFDDETVLQICDEAVKCDRKTKLIIGCETIDLERIANMREKFLPRDDFIIIANKITPQSKVSEIAIKQMSHKFSDLSDDSPILKIKFNFQGEEMSLNNFMKECKEIIDVFPIENIRKDYSPIIGQEIRFDKNHVIRRYEIFKPIGNEELTYEELMNEAKLGKVVLLSDAPGNGKTMEFQYLSKRLKESFPFRWVTYIDLKKHVRCFNDKKYPEMFNSNMQLAVFFKRELLKLEGFDAEIFTELFISHRAIILLDGFDEVSPTYKQFMTKLVVAIKENSNNMLWIATRPLYRDELKKKMNAEVFRMSGFNEDDRNAIIQNYLINEGLSDRQFKTTYDNIEIFLERIKGEFFQSQIKNPLFLQIIAKVFISNHESHDNYDNMYKFYRKFVNKMFEEAGRKQVIDVEQNMAEFSSGDINIKSYHQKLALELTWRKPDSMIILDYDIDNSDEYFETIPDHISLICDAPSSIALEKLNRIGLMYSEGSYFYFIHRTFAEFFVAQVICENLFMEKKVSGEKIEALIKLFKFVLASHDSSVIRMFMDMFLKDCGDSQDQFTISKFTQNNKIENIYELKNVAEEYCFNLFDFISFKIIHNLSKLQEHWIFRSNAVYLFQYLSSDRIKLHLDSFEDSTIKKILLKKDIHNCNCFFAAVKNRDKDVLALFLSYAIKILCSEELSNVLQIPICYHIYDEDKYCEIFERLKANLDQELFSMFLKRNLEIEENFNSLISNHNRKVIEWLFTRYIKIKGEYNLRNVLRRQIHYSENSKRRYKKICLYLPNFFMDGKLEDVLLNELDSENENILAAINNESDLETLFDLYVNTFSIEFMKPRIGILLGKLLESRDHDSIRKCWIIINNRFEVNDLFQILMKLPDNIETKKFFRICFPEIKEICKNSEISKTLELLRKVMHSFTFEMIQEFCSCLNLDVLSTKSSDDFLELIQFLVKVFRKIQNESEIHEIFLKNGKLKQSVFVLLLNTYYNYYEDNSYFDYKNNVNDDNHHLAIAERIGEFFGLDILKLLFLYDIDSKSFKKYPNVKKNMWNVISDRFESNDLFQILMKLPDDSETKKFFRFCFPEIKKICENSKLSQTLNILRKVINSLTLDMIREVCSCLSLDVLSVESSDDFLELIQFLVKTFRKILNESERYEIVLRNNKLKQSLFVLLHDTYCNFYERNYYFDDDNDVNDNIHIFAISKNIEELFGLDILKLLLLYYFDSNSIFMHLRAKGHIKTEKAIVMNMNKYLNPDQIDEILLRTDSEGNRFSENFLFKHVYNEYLKEINSSDDFEFNFPVNTLKLPY